MTAKKQIDVRNKPQETLATNRDEETKKQED
jgi:hypothetical protein